MKDNRQKKEQAFKWQKEQTTQYNLRFMNSTGVPAAIDKVCKATGQTSAEYMKSSIVQRLHKEGYLDKEVVLNLNKTRHREKIKRLKKYIEQEEQKMK